MLPDKTRSLLAEVFTPDWEEGRRSNRLDKCEALYQLGQEAQEPIVELGAWQGCGCTTLAFGSKAGMGVPVFGIDDYQPRTGAFNDPYVPEDEIAFWNNVNRCRVNVGLIRKPSLDAAWDWSGPLGVVYWDLSHGSCVPDFVAWMGKISPGGRFVVGDTIDHIFEGDKMAKKAVSLGWSDLGRWGQFLYVVEKNE
jgi:hypothetical protein